MTADAPTPLATAAQFTAGPFADLVADFSATAVTDLLIQATRACESAVDRRLVPFTGITESQRAQAVDMEDSLDAYFPLDPTSQLGMSRAQSLGATTLVRHFWLREHPPRYQEFWTGSISNIQLRRSFSGTENMSISQLQYEVDTGHVRFQLGTFVPVGTTLVITYSGGYATIPADLVQACQYMAASMAIRQLDPTMNRGHDPDLLRTESLGLLAAYVRR